MTPVLCVRPVSLCLLELYLLRVRPSLLPFCTLPVLRYIMAQPTSHALRPFSKPLLYFPNSSSFSSCRLTWLAHSRYSVCTVEVYTCVPHYPQGIRSKPPCEHLTPWRVPSPVHAVVFPICTYLFTEGKHFTASRWHIRIAGISIARLAFWVIISKIRVT